MIIERDISQITVGTYIVDIAAQKGQYNLASSGWVKSAAVIEVFKSKGIERFLVDTSKQRVNRSTPDIPSGDRTSFLQEISHAKEIFKQSKVIQRKLFDDAKNGTLIDLAPVKQITDESIEAIFNNPDALACVINVRQKDEYLLEHSIAVSVLITIFARYMGIDREIIGQLSIGAFLHDVGKIKVPDQILNKPGKLSKSEFEVMKTHVNHSIEAIQAIPGISALACEVAAQHHEKLNGRGYPLGLPQQQISVYGRMISICDIFDALTAGRCYKDGYPQVKAFTILRKLAQDNHLDSTLVDTFIKCLGVYPVGALVKLDSNRLAIVESRNRQDSIRPRVKPFYNLNQKSFEMTEQLDLSSATDELIVKCVRADDFDLDMEQIIDFLSDQG